jgi:hypothetical protein
VKAETLRRETRQRRLLDGIPFRARNLLFYISDHKLVIARSCLPATSRGMTGVSRIIRQISSMFAAGDRSFEDAGPLDNPYTLLYRGH